MSDEPGWALNGRWHASRWETLDGRRAATGSCVCGLPLDGDDYGLRTAVCATVSESLRVEHDFVTNIRPQRAPRLSGWWVRLRQEYNGWRWHAWEDWAAPSYTAPDRNGRKRFAHVADAVDALAGLGCTFVNVQVGFRLWSPSPDDLARFDDVGALVRVTYGH